MSVATYRSCRECGQEMSAKRPRVPGTVSYGADDRCKTCYQRVLRARPRPVEAEPVAAGAVRAKPGDVWPGRP